MLSSTVPESGAALERPATVSSSWPAWLVSISGCIALLTTVKYLPTNFQGNITLFQVFLNTFWESLKEQVSGFFSGAPQGSLAAETTLDQWSYCALVPLIVAWLVWRIWPQLRALPAQGTTDGYWLFGGGLFLFATGFWIEHLDLGIVAMELIYAGLIVLFWGWPAMRLLLFPVGFLLFMWPYQILEESALQLRLVMAILGQDTLHLLGVASVRVGTAIISVPGAATPFALDVADPCSGIRSLFALVMVAALYGFLSCRRIWQQAIVVALALPLSVLGNLVRLVLLALATIQFGQKFAVGTNHAPTWFHEGMGYLVYVVDLGGLWLAGWLLRRFSPERPSPARPRPAEHPEKIVAPVIPLGRSLIVLALFSMVLLFGLLAPLPGIGPSGVVVSLPDRVGPLVGEPQKISAAEQEILPPDTTFARKTYGLPGDNPIERVLCTIVQAGNVPRSLHRPERCLPAQGYEIKDNRVVTIPLKSGQPLEARLYHLDHFLRTKDGRKITMQAAFLYWYVGGGGANCSRWEMSFITNWDLLFYHFSPRWSYVYVMAYALDSLQPGARSLDQTMSLLKAFVRESTPHFMRSEMAPGP